MKPVTVMRPNHSITSITPNDPNPKLQLKKKGEAV
jgi:hypothetical protein